MPVAGLASRHARAGEAAAIRACRGRTPEASGPKSPRGRRLSGIDGAPFGLPPPLGQRTSGFLSIRAARTVGRNETERGDIKRHEYRVELASPDGTADGNWRP